MARRLAGKRTTKTFGIYMFGNTLDRALPFLMLPILTRWLSADDYGIIGTFIVITNATHAGNLNGCPRRHRTCMDSQRIELQ